MKHVSASEARTEAGRSLEERVRAFQPKKVIVPVSGEPEGPLTPLEMRRLRDEEDALRIASGCAALRMRTHEPTSFYPFRTTGYGNADIVDRRTIQRLVDKGLMAWVSPSIRSAAVLVVDRGEI